MDTQCYVIPGHGTIQFDNEGVAEGWVGLSLVLRTSTLKGIDTYQGIVNAIVGKGIRVKTRRQNPGATNLLLTVRLRFSEATLPPDWEEFIIYFAREFPKAAAKHKERLARRMPTPADPRSKRQRRLEKVYALY